MQALGPENGSLTIRTGRSGAASKAGHDLLIEVTAWEATLGDDAMSLTADSRSLRVLEGTGGVTSLGDEEKASIRQSIDEDVLKGGTIAFRSTSVARGEDGTLRVEGDLDLLGTSRPIAFTLSLDGGRLTGGATFKQSDWGIKPFSILFGTLKVADELRVEIDATVQSR